MEECSSPTCNTCNKQYKITSMPNYSKKRRNYSKRKWFRKSRENVQSEPYNATRTILN